MSNIIPPLLSSTPPPISDNFDEDEDDEFGDYRTAGDTSLACDSPSIPPTPEFSPKKSFEPVLDINSNDSKKISAFKSNEVVIAENADMKTGTKDFHDRRKSSDCSRESTEFSISSTDDTLSKNSNTFEQVDREINSLSCDFKTENDKTHIDCKTEVSKESTINGCECRESNERLAANGIIRDEQQEELSQDTTLNLKTTFAKYDCVEDDFTDFSSCTYGSGPSQNCDNNTNVKILNLSKTGDVDDAENSQEFDFDVSKNVMLNDHVEKHDFDEFTSSEDSVAFAIVSQSNVDISSLEENSSQDLEIKPHLQVSSLVQGDTENEIPSNSQKSSENINQENDNEFSDFITSPEQNCETKTEEFGFNIDILKQAYFHFQPEEDDEFDDFVACETPAPVESSGSGSTFKENTLDSFKLEEIKKSAIPTVEMEENHEETEGGFNEFVTCQEQSDYPYVSNSSIKLSSNDNVKSCKEEKTGESSMSNSEGKVDEAIEDDTDEFDDFKTCTNLPVQIEPQPTISSITRPIKNDDEEFENFADFSSAPSVQNQEGDEDDFGDFASQVIYDSGTQGEEHIMLDINSDGVFEKAETIVKIMFDHIESPLEEFCIKDICENSVVFSALKDVTDTKALSYQWAKSSSQKSLLKALNIDESDILYGPSMNLSLPRFAANLSIAPLEPIKSDLTSSNSIQGAQPTNSSPSCISADVPTAQFDWSSSGLTNPLDSKIAKEKAEGLSPNQETSVNKENPSLRFEQPSSVDCLTPSLSSLVLQPEIVNFLGTKSDAASNLNNCSFPDFSTNNTVLANQNNIVPDSFDFTISSTSEQQTWPSVVPLRETHISQDEKGDSEHNSVGWLQPTILTPVTARKEVSPTLEDDDFDDFQMVLPNEGTTSIGDLSKALPKDFEQGLGVGKITSDSLFGEFELSRENKEETVTEKKDTSKATDFSDDEFTDFHSSFPVANALKLGSENKQQTLKQPVSEVTESLSHLFSQPLQPVPLEPLKPVAVHPTSPAKPTQINWPNPGITDEDLHNINLTYSIKPPDIVKNDQENVSPIKMNEVKKERSLDDDDWTDFVSVQEPNVGKQLANKPERTSTPDLPLSVLNLGHVQPIKQPIPVITPKGLIQTQLPSSAPPLKVVQTSIYNHHLNNMQHINVQPSLISNQYIGQAYQKHSPNFSSGSENSMKNLPNANLPAKTMPHRSQNVPNSAPVKQNLDDDDYWSDFVSSKPANHSSNNVQHRVASTSSKSFQHLNGLFQNNTPNIITNPGHFDAFQSYVPANDVSKSTRVTNVHSKKSAVSSVSAVPELDFVAPKSRTSHRK